MTRDDVYLRHILDAIAKIETYVAAGREAFLQESHWHDAAIRQLEVIGEATKRLSSELRGSHQDVPWQQIAGLRDVLIHQYESVDLTLVWEIVQRRLPDLKRRAEEILEGEPKGDG